MHDTLTISERLPSTSDFLTLRATTGWSTICANIADISLRNSLYFIGLYDANTLIAMGRVVGDGAMYFYIQDVVVDPQYQGQGLGNRIMQSIEAYLRAALPQGATAALLSVKGKEDFYTRFGYQKRDGKTLGLGMSRFVTGKTEAE